MLYIATDLKNRNWLVYILEEFTRINNANFDIKIIDVNNANDIKDQNLIYYTKEFVKKTALINKSDILPAKNILKISKDIFVIDKTITDDDRFACKYDMFWNAFIFLSRLEEYLNENRGKKIRSYSLNHPRSEKSTFDIPIVNNLFDELEKIIKDKFPNLTFGEKQRPIVELSHDVDYIEKTLQLRTRRTALNIYKTLRNIYKISDVLKGASNIAKFLIANSPYWCFDYWEKLEKEFQKRSVFYIYVKTNKRDFTSWLFDPSYNVNGNTKLKDELRHLISEGFEIGLHGSFKSATDEELLASEKKILSSLLGFEIDKVRQHWLRYEENVTPYIHDKLFQFDSTLGWNDRMGFRSGCVSRYRPYNHRAQAPFNVFETPQIIMDSNIFDYGKDVHMEHRAMQLLDSISDYKTSHVSICWHQRACNSDYKWHTVYEELIKR